ncbi:MAG TPA: lipopolysaccharide heptosyltransferase II [Nitrospiraceae bacterium]|nr:lipopolysaccharide heptosyltransferase II [Nitrospiraceae bacterium]
MAESIKNKKILIRGVNWIGDAVLTTPTIQALRKAFPQAHISLLVRPWVAPIFESNPHINEIILYEDSFKRISGKFKLAKILREKNFDTAILLQNAFDAALIAWLSRIPERIGYERDRRGLLLTKAIPVTKEILKKHQVYYYLNLIETMGIRTEKAQLSYPEVSGQRPYIYLRDEEIQQARTLLTPSPTTYHQSPIIGINPGATYGSAKRWMSERFAWLAQRIINELNGKVVIFGSQSEVKIAEEIVKTVKNISHFSFPISHLLVMAGKTDLRELITLINECDAFITNDSGPMHIASALGVPTVAIFGSTDPCIAGPFGNGHMVIKKNMQCSPCLKRECPEGSLKCMDAITVEDVFDALQEILPKNKAVLLDRDGTLIEDAHYLNDFSKLKIFHDAKQALARLKTAGFKLIGITNQSGIARGIVTEEFVKESNSYIQKELGIDAFYYCPHHPDDSCMCRKPEQGLLQKARLEHGINLKNSYIIGDKLSDMLVAKRAGAKGILVMTGDGVEVIQEKVAGTSYVADNLDDAVNLILRQDKQ